MIGFDLEGNVMGGPGSLGDEGADLSSISVLNVAPTTSVKQDFSSIMSGVSVPSLSSMTQFYLDDELISSKVAQPGSGLSPLEKSRQHLMDFSEQGRYGPQNIQYVQKASEFFGGQPPGSTDNPAGKNPYTDDPTKQGLFEPLGTPMNPNTYELEQGYFNDLTAAYPSFRAPSPQGGSKQRSDITPFAAFPITNSEGVTSVYDVEGNLINRYEGQPTKTEEQAQRDALRARQEQLYGSPDYTRRSTFPGEQGEMFGFNELTTALPAYYNEEQAASFNKRFGNTRIGTVKAGDPFINPTTMRPSGNIGMITTGISGGDYLPGEALPQNFLPDNAGGRYLGIGTFDPIIGRRPDMIKMIRNSPSSVLVHEKYHGALRGLALYSDVWKDKIDFNGAPLIDALTYSNGDWDAFALHIAVYAGSQNMLPKGDHHQRHRMFKDITSNNSLNETQKYSMKLARAKELSRKLNDAAKVVLDSEDLLNQTMHKTRPDDWFVDEGATWKHPGG